MKELHAIRPPVVVGMDPAILKIVLVAAAGIVVLFLLGLLFRKWWKKKTVETDVKALPILLPPYKTALNELDLLSNASTDHPRVYYFELTLILRRYISRRFHIHGVEMTSQEFIRQINPLPMEQNMKNQIGRFQEYCDPIKYAGRVPEPGKIKTDLDLVRQMVETIETCQVKAETAESEQETEAR